MSKDEEIQLGIKREEEWEEKPNLVFPNEDIKKGFYVNTLRMNIGTDVVIIDFGFLTPDNEMIVGSRIITHPDFAKQLPEQINKIFEDTEKRIKEEKKKLSKK